MARLWRGVVCCGLALLGLGAGARAEDGHLNVPPGQHVQLTFTHQSGDPTNVFAVVNVLFPDGTLVLDYRIPKGLALVVTDIHMQVFRPDDDVSAPLDGVLQLSSRDRSGSADALLVTLPLSAAANQRRTGFSHSFTAGFTFSGKRSPELTPIVLSGGSVDGNFLQASGYLVKEKRGEDR